MKSSILLLLVAIGCHEFAVAFPLVSNPNLQRQSRPWVTTSFSTSPIVCRTQLYFLEKQEYADSQIPEEFRKDIEEAEAKTPAAKDRADRIFIYTAIGVLFLAFALSSAIYGKVVDFENPDADGFASIEETLWFQASKALPILSTKFGLYIDMAVAGLCYFLVENEYVRKFNTQEEIWKEIKRRKEASMAGGKTKKAKVVKAKGKKGGRMKAFAEVIDVEEEKAETEEVPSVESIEAPVSNDQEKSKEGGMLGKLKDFYSKADDMAAAQALLLNKKLEDTGVVEKITDETGLKVIGKDAAKKLSEDNKTKESE